MDIYDLWFSSTNLSSRKKLKILKKFKSIQKIWINLIYNNISIDFCDNIYENNRISKELKSSWNRNKLEYMIEYCYKKGINSVNFNEKYYPSRLKSYEDSPAVLFYMGNIVELNKNLNVGIVGSRSCSMYGKIAAESIAREVSKNKIGVISGMAKGIDSFAHRGCISANGYTCAVLGSGVDIIYPRENKELYYSILENGCIISEFIPGTKPFSYNFPKRNRIISGFSDVLVVVEAAEKSGALITADIALEQGKSVMSVPGSIFSNESKGTNKLIIEGAYPFTKLEDLFQLLEVEYEIKTSETRDKSSSLTKKEEKIYDILSDVPIHIDEIFRITNIDIKQLYELLFELQLKNEIKCLSGNYYIKVPNRNNVIQ